MNSVVTHGRKNGNPGTRQGVPPWRVPPSATNRLPSREAIGRLKEINRRIAPKLVSLARDLERYEAAPSLRRRFRREAYAIPLGVLRGILLLGSDPSAGVRELRSVRIGTVAVRKQLRRTRITLCAPQDKVVDVIDDLERMEDLTDTLLSLYEAPILFRRPPKVQAAN